MKVGIIGAGICGLATALAFEQNNIEYEVFEQDDSFLARSQGYSLTMQQHGIWALKEMGIEKDVRKKGNQLTNYITKNFDGEIILDKEIHNIYVLPRNKLRKCMLNALKQPAINWSHKCKSFEQFDDGVLVEFTSGKKEKFDIVCACDGIRSIFRSSLIGDELCPLGVVAILGISDFKLDNCTENQMVDGVCRLFSKPFNKNQTMWQLTFESSKHQIDQLLSEFDQK